MKHPEDNKTMDILETKPGRKALPTAEAVVVDVDHEAIEAAGRAATAVVLMDQQANEQARSLAVQLGYEGSLDIGVLEDGIRFHQRRTVEACIELGKRLLLLKQVTIHGEFKQRIELLGISTRMAQRFMGATLKFSKSDAKSLLEVVGTQTKLLELVVLDDDEIAALADGESVGDVTLDRIDSMSVTELRKALRDRDQTIEAKDKVLQDRNEKLQDAEEKLHRPFKPAKGALARNAEQQSHMDELRESITAAELTFARVSVAVATVVEQSDSEAVVKAANDGLAYLITRIRDLANAHQLVLDTSDEAFGLKPDWM